MAHIILTLISNLAYVLGAVLPHLEHSVGCVVGGALMLSLGWVWVGAGLGLHFWPVFVRGSWQGCSSVGGLG